MTNTTNTANAYDIEHEPGNEIITDTWDGDVPFRSVLLEALDRAMATPMTDADPLYNEIDLEGIERFITNSDNENVYALFSYGDYYVEVSGDGEIEVSPFDSIY